MSKHILTKTQLHSLISENRYKIDPKTEFISRCIDGRYENKEDLPALAYPGADAGELALILATANAYGFEANGELAFQSLAEVVGGEQHLSFHTDSHADKAHVLAGCGHIKQINASHDDYSVTQEQSAFIIKKFGQVLKQGAKQEVLHGDHNEEAVVMINGNYGIYPKYTLQTDESEIATSIFEYHKTLVDARHKKLAKTLIKNNAVTLPEGCGEDYLYQVFSETSENHLMETAGRLAKGLPIYQVTFKDNGEFKIEEMGNV